MSFIDAVVLAATLAFSLGIAFVVQKAVLRLMLRAIDTLAP
jgi:hypothetical protein